MKKLTNLIVFVFILFALSCSKDSENDTSYLLEKLEFGTDSTKSIMNFYYNSNKYLSKMEYINYYNDTISYDLQYLSDQVKVI